MGFRPELLAAYADGELDPETRAKVGRWLIDNPGTLEELKAQREFGPGNAALWECVEPPEPSSGAWAAVRSRVEAGLACPREVAPPAGRWRVSVLAALAACCAGLLGIGAGVGWLARRPLPSTNPGVPPVEVARVPPSASPEVAPTPRAATPVQEPDPLEGFVVLPIADEFEVILDRVPDTRAGWLPVGRHPLPDVVALASVEDVHLEDVEPSPAWPPGGPRMTTAPGEAPMIFAARPR